MAETRKPKAGIQPITYYRHLGTRVEPVQGFIVEEVPLCIRVHGQPWVQLMCSPHDMEDLVLGFLRAEGLISSLQDVVTLDWKFDPPCVDVHLTQPPDALPDRPTLTTGCSGGITFENLTAHFPPLEEDIHVPGEAIIGRMRDLIRNAPLYRQARGIHSSALSTADRLLLQVEDVGRHNTLDRLWGQAMRRGVETRGHLIVTTGRISVEMLHKAAKMGVPLIASRTSPTNMAVRLARAWRITVVGYVRPHSFRVYTHPERVRP